MANPTYTNGKWVVKKDPDDIRFYKFGLAAILTDAGTTASSVTAIVAGVTVATAPVIQGTDVIVKLGGFDTTANAENKCTVRVVCANGEQIDATMWFEREDR